MKSQAIDKQNNVDQVHMGQKIQDLEKDKNNSKQIMDEQKTEISQLNDNIKQYQK